MNVMGNGVLYAGMLHWTLDDLIVMGGGSTIKIIEVLPWTSYVSSREKPHSMFIISYSDVMEDRIILTISGPSVMIVIRIFMLERQNVKSISAIQNRRFWCEINSGD